MDKDSHFSTVMHKRVCEQTELMGFFDPAGYGMLGCPMSHRSARIINRPAELPAKSDRMENLANSSVTRTARHGRNPHSSGIFTFSFEEGSNFVQNIRHNGTFRLHAGSSFSYVLFDVVFTPLQGFVFQQYIEGTQKLHPKHIIF